VVSQPSAVKLGKRAAQKAETKQRLISIAVEVFAENDYDQVTVADIAERAGVAHGLLFHYFKSKRGIYLEAVRASAEQMNAAFAAVTGTDAGELLRSALEQHLTYLRDHRGLALRLVLGGRSADPQAWEIYEAARWDVLGGLAMLLGLDQNNRALRFVGRVTVGAIDEASIQWLNNPDDFDLPQLVGWMESLIVACLSSASVLDPGADIAAALASLK
jgi:AcrR family transcriptional regulator